jgi:hypothetical protein
MNPVQMAALGHHAAATAPAAQQAADESLLAARQAEEAAALQREAGAAQKRAADEQLRLAREAAARQSRQGQAYDAAVRLFSTSLTRLPLMVLGNLMHGRTAFLGLEKERPAGGQRAGGPQTPPPPPPASQAPTPSPQPQPQPPTGPTPVPPQPSPPTQPTGPTPAGPGPRPTPPVPVPPPVPPTPTPAPTFPPTPTPPVIPPPPKVPPKVPPAPAASGAAGAGGLAVAGPVGAAVGLALSLGKLIGDGIRTMHAAPTSGAQTFNKAMGLLTASIAPVLMPAMFLLAVAAASSADVLFGELLPAMGDLSTLLVQVALPALVQFAKALAVAAKYALAPVKFLGQKGVEANERAAKEGKGEKAGGSGLFDFLTLAVPALAPLNLAAKMGDQKKGESTVKDAMGNTLGELKLLAMRTPVAAGGSASAYTRAQTAVLGQSPFERRMTEMVNQVVTMMAKSANKSTPAPPASGAFNDAKKRN